MCIFVAGVAFSAIQRNFSQDTRVDALLEKKKS
jgi:hypothetical protein